MIKTKEDLLFYLQADARANGICTSRQYIVRLIGGGENALIIQYLRKLRKQEYHYNNIESIFHRLLFYWYKYRTAKLSLKTHITIGLNMVGPGLRIPHTNGGVVINCKSMGSNCIVNTGVLLGNKKAEEIAIVGNNCDLCAGCKIIGGVRIGNNVTVAPNAVVVKDVPDNAIVAGVPAKIIRIKDKTI